MKKALITGGYGFIGTVLCKKLRTLGYTLKIIDLSDNKDILSYDRDGDYDIVFHLASPISIEESIYNPNRYFDTIIKGTYRLLDMFRDTRFINISSSAACEPITSPYGISKRATELMTIEMAFPKALTCRIYNVFGEGERHRIIYHWARLMLLNETVQIYGDGTARRDYVYIEDAVNAIVKYGLKSNIKGLIEIGHAKTTDNNTLFKMMADFYEYKKSPVYVPARPGDPDITVSNNDIGTGIGFEKGLIKTLQYYREKFKNAKEGIYTDFA